MSAMFRRRGRRSDPERSGSGAPVYRYPAVERGWEAAAPPDTMLREALGEHLEGLIGPCDSVWHEIASDLVHLDVTMWRPTPDRPFYTFVTEGMSDLPMAVPADDAAEGSSRFVELVLCLPDGWPVPGADGATAPWQDEGAYFPIWWLKMLARLPHEYRTWLGFGHSVPNGDPAEPLAPGSELVGWMILPPLTLPAGSDTFCAPDGRRVQLFGVVALTGPELDRKLAQGTGSLLDAFDAHGVTELLDVYRASAV